MISNALFTAPRYDEYHRLIDRLIEYNRQAYFVGGCVRDELRGAPPHDVDITTSATPDEVLEIFNDYRVIKTGIKHGTVTLIMSDGSPCEITTFRTEFGYSDNRHPDKVEFVTDLYADLARRDFTVNAMAFNRHTGLVDNYDGYGDLQKGIIKTVLCPSDRFKEDGLRILRALRFAAKLSFTIDPDTAQAIKNDKELLKNIAAERIQSEFNEFLLYPTSINILNEFKEVFAVFIPEFESIFNYDQKNFHHRFDLWEHTLRCALYVPNTLPLKLAALFHDLGKPATRTIDQNGTAHYYGHADISAQITDFILRRLKYSTAIREQVVTLVKAHMNMPPETKKAALKMLNNLGDSLSFDLLDLIAADRKATTGKYSGKETNAAKELISQQLALKQCFTLSSLNINGKDLISIGIPEGKEIGRILNALLSAVIDGKIQNEPAELIKAAKELIYT